MCEGQATLSNSQTQEVRAELTSLLESASFRTSKRCREFLEYIVDHTISGPSGTLKERSILVFVRAPGASPDRIPLIGQLASRYGFRRHASTAQSFWQGSDHVPWVKR